MNNEIKKIKEYITWTNIDNELYSLGIASDITDK